MKSNLLFPLTIPALGVVSSNTTFSNPKPERGLRALQLGCFARVRVPGEWGEGDAGL
jgi:hypothetical protein